MRLDIAVNGEAVDAMARIVHRNSAEKEGRRVALRLKEILSRELFDVVIQVRVGRGGCQMNDMVF